MHGGQPARWSAYAAALWAWAVAIGLLPYWGANMVRFGLMKLHLIDTPDSVGPDAADWYVFLWEPIWLLGGCLFAAAAWSFARR
jgi:hypothetical protein